MFIGGGDPPTVLFSRGPTRYKVRTYGALRPLTAREHRFSLSVRRIGLMPKGGAGRGYLLFMVLTGLLTLFGGACEHFDYRPTVPAFP